jgi:hypothetical protein
MPDTFKTVRSGEPLEIAAEWKNLGNDVFQVYKRSRQNGGAAPIPPFVPDPDFIKVKNNSGFDVDRFGILGLDDPIFNPTDSLQEFKNSVVFVGVTPIFGAHKGHFCIIREPLGDQRIGTAWVMGACRALVNVVDLAHQWADVMDGDATQLQSDWGGSARILWRESGLGQKWAYLLLGATDVGEPQYQGQNLTGVAQNARGWDFQRAYALPGV